MKNLFSLSLLAVAVFSVLGAMSVDNHPFFRNKPAWRWVVIVALLSVAAFEVYWASNFGLPFKLK